MFHGYSYAGVDQKKVNGHVDTFHTNYYYHHYSQ